MWKNVTEAEKPANAENNSYVTPEGIEYAKGVG